MPDSCRTSIVTSKGIPFGGTKVICRLKDESAWTMLNAPRNVPVLHLLKYQGEGEWEPGMNRQEKNASDV